MLGSPVSQHKPLPREGSVAPATGLANILHQQNLLRAKLANLDQQSELLTRLGTHKRPVSPMLPFSSAEQTTAQKPSSPSLPVVRSSSGMGSGSARGGSVTMGGSLLRGMVKTEGVSYTSSFPSVDDFQRDAEPPRYDEPTGQQGGIAGSMHGGMYDSMQFQLLQQQMQAQQQHSNQMQGQHVQGYQMQGYHTQGHQMQSQHMESREAELQEMEGQEMDGPKMEGQPSSGFDDELPMSTATKNKLNQINHIMRALHTVQRLKQSLVAQQSSSSGQYPSMGMDGQADAAGFEGQMVDMDGTQIPRESWMLPSEKTLMKRESWLQDPAVDGGVPDGRPYLPLGATGPMMPMMNMIQQPTLNGDMGVMSQGSLPTMVSVSNSCRQRINVKRLRMTAKQGRGKDEDEEDDAGGDDDGDGDDGDEGATKRRRRKKSAQQMCMLREVFGVNPKPTKMCIRVIAQNTHLTYQEVSRWFRNERHKSKKGSVPRSGGGGVSASSRLANKAAGPADDDNEGDADGDTWENDDDDGDEENDGWA
jgi:hypothetical protein